MEKNRKDLLLAYFSAWLRADASVLPRVFAPDARYTESYGPVYRGLAEITAWFHAWNERGRVLFWEMDTFVETGDSAICTWYFSNRYDGVCDSFEGVTWARFDAQGRITDLREYGSALPHRYPFAREAFPYEVRPLREAELAPALDLAWRVFQASVAPGYTQEGVSAFRDFLLCSAVLEKLRAGTMRLWGCFDGEKIIGMAGVRDKSHLCLLFVDPAWQRHGVATMLLRGAAQAAREAGADRLTVNAAPGALWFYRAFGFHETDVRQYVDGISFIPMEYQLRQEEPA